MMPISAQQQAGASQDVLPVFSVPGHQSGLPAYDELAAAFRLVLEGGDASGEESPRVRELEEAAGAMLGTHVVAVASAGLGLIFALQALGLKPGQRVVVPSLTAAATVQAILYAGGVPVFAEVGPDLTLAPDDLEQLLAAHQDIAAVVPTHLLGLPCDVTAIQAVVTAAAARCGRPIALVYDAAHAFGASSHGVRLGRSGSAEVFSLPVSDELGGIHGGLVASQHVGLVRRIRKMRNCGLDIGERMYWPGIDGQLSDLHAIVLRASLRGFPEQVAERQRLAHHYGACLERVAAARLLVPAATAPSFHRLVTVVPPYLQAYRDQMLRLLHERGIEASSHGSHVTHQEPYFQRYATRPLPRTEQASRSVISLPLHDAASDDEVASVAAALADAERRVSHLGTTAASDESGA